MALDAEAGRAQGVRRPGVRVGTHLGRWGPVDAAPD